MTTTCRHCRLSFDGGVEIIGHPNARMESLIHKLGEHMATNHPQIMQAMQIDGAAYLGMLFLTNFQSADETLNLERDRQRWVVHQRTLSARFTDESLQLQCSELGARIVKRIDDNAKSDAVVATLGAARAAEPPVSTKPIEQMTEDEKRAHVDHLWKKWGGHLISISTRLVEEFTIQDQGYSFRDWYVEMYGKLRWADLKRDIAPELMTNIYLAHEQLKKPLSPPERLNAFLVEFATNFGEEKGVTVEDDVESQIVSMIAEAMTSIRDALEEPNRYSEAKAEQKAS